MKKIISLVLVLVLALTAIGGTLAYFTDEDETKNTFVTGNVKLDLYEETEVPIQAKDENGNPKVGEDGKPVYEMNEDGTIKYEKVQVEEINYTEAMVPGHVFAKNPTVKLLKKGETITSTTEEMLGKETPYDSQPAYVYLDMTINKHKSLFPVMALDALEAKDEEGNTLISQEQFDSCVDTSTKEVDGEQVTVKTFKASKFVALMIKNPATFQKIIGRWFKDINHEQWMLMDVFYDHVTGDVTKAANGAERLTFRFAYIGGNDYYTDPTTAIMEHTDDPVQFMSAFQMPYTVTQEMLENDLTQKNFNTVGEKFQMDFKAYAIQADLVDKTNVKQVGVEDAYDEMFGYAVDSNETSFAKKFADLLAPEAP